MSGEDTGRLAGQVAVVTGASRGIGYALSLALAREGTHVIAVARTVGGLAMQIERRIDGAAFGIRRPATGRAATARRHAQGG